MHNEFHYIYLPTAKTFLLYHTQGGGNFNLKSEIEVLNGSEKGVCVNHKTYVFKKKNIDLTLLASLFDFFYHGLVLVHLSHVLENQF